MPEPKYMSAAYVRSFVFGVEDSLVSTVGLLSGIAIANVSRGTILLTGIVLIFVEAFSMAAGMFLSEKSAEEYVLKQNTSSHYSFVASVIMFFSYFIAGFIPLAPYVFADVASAFIVSIVLSLIALFVLGAASARLSQIRFLRESIRMLVIGGIAIGVGIAAGIITQKIY